MSVTFTRTFSIVTVLKSKHGVLESSETWCLLLNINIVTMEKVLVNVVGINNFCLFLLH
jgi:hypothetical protein